MRIRLLKTQLKATSYVIIYTNFDLFNILILIAKYIQRHDK